MRQLFFFLLVILIGGCDSNDPRLSSALDYQQRLYRLLDFDAEPLTFDALSYPDKRQLAQPVEPVPIRWSDFFSTVNCGQLQQLIAEKNSQLGRVMEPATELFYEVSVRSELQLCTEQLSRLSADWQHAIRKKEKQFPAKVWSNTWGSDYWQQMMSSATHKSAVSKTTVSELVSALAQLRIALKQSASDKKRWYQPFHEMERHQGVIGSLLFEAQGQWKVMQATNTALSEKVNRVCPQSIPTKTSDYLFNVLTRFYTSNLQRRQAELLEALIMLENEFAQWTHVFPNDNRQFDAWLGYTLKHDSPERLSRRLTDSVRQHIELWKSLGEHCGRSIGNAR